jgi:Flp pilus assembly protein TadB
VDRAISDIIIAVVSVSIIAGATLFGYWLSLGARREARRSRSLEAEQLQADLEAIRADLGAQIAELQDRLEFAERLLAQGPRRQALEPPPDQPGGNQ